MLDTDGHSSFSARQIYAKNVEKIIYSNASIPSDLVEAISSDINEGLDASNIEDKYGDRLKSYGIKIDQVYQWVDRAAKGADLLAAIGRLFG